MNIKLCILLFLIPFYITNSQVTQEWAAIFNGQDNLQDIGFSLTVDGNGNVYVAAGSMGGSSGMDFLTIKYNSNGIMQWTQRYSGAGNGDDFPTTIKIDESGNIYVTGYSYGIGSGRDVTTIKYTASGNLIWVRLYNDTNTYHDFGNGLAFDNAFNVYIRGASHTFSSGYDCLLLKYDSSGSLLWDRKYNGPANSEDGMKSMIIKDDYIYLTGYSTPVGTNRDFFTMKYNLSGDTVWTRRRYSSLPNFFDYGSAVCADNSGNIYVTGVVKNSSPNFDDYCTIKYNQSGTVQWEKTYNYQSSSWDEASYLLLDNQANIYVSGLSNRLNSISKNDIATVKYNPAGDLLWVQRYNGTGNDEDLLYGMTGDSLGNIYLTGQSIGLNNLYEYCSIKYTPSGSLEWTQRYNRTGSDHNGAKDIFLDNSQNVYVTGSSPGIGTQIDIATIKYSQVIGIQTISSEIPQKYALFQNYPNPFNPNCKIRFSLPQNVFVKLVLFDVSGCEVASFVNRQLDAGTYEITFNGTNFSSGIYFYKLITDNYSEAKKMILVK